MSEFVFVCGNCGNTEIHDASVNNIKCGKCGLGYFQNTGFLQLEWEAINSEKRQEIVDSIVHADKMSVEELDLIAGRMNRGENSKEVRNTAGRIKNAATIVKVLGIIISIIGSIQLFSLAHDVDPIYGMGEFYWFSGEAVLVLGPIISWIVGLRLYTCGQLVEKADKIIEQNEILITKKKK